MRSLASCLAGLVVLGLAAGAAPAADPAPPLNAPPALVERGRYLVRIAGCNDCHTPGYIAQSGAVPEQEWLTGDTLGWRGPWGTTYAINLRLYMNGMSEAQWLSVARSVQSRPPMPWFNLRAMTDDDLRAIYHFVRSLGPRGAPAPAFMPPGVEPKPPYVLIPGPPK